jgi:hypothetical protein
VTWLRCQSCISTQTQRLLVWPESALERIVASMGRTKRKPEMIYVDPDKFERLKQLAKTTRIPRAVLWREALDDLLMKHEVSEEKQRNS